jgi:single-strand DNA-binding protein
MKSLNNVTVMGYLGADAEIYEYPDGGCKVTLKVATDDGMGQSKKTNWHTVVMYAEVARLAMKLKKGDFVLAQGCLEYKAWTDRHNQNRVNAEIRAQELRIITGEINQSSQRRDQNNGPQQANQQRQGPQGSQQANQQRQGPQGSQQANQQRQGAQGSQQANQQRQGAQGSQQANQQRQGPQGSQQDNQKISLEDELADANADNKFRGSEYDLNNDGGYGYSYHTTREMYPNQ